MKNIHVPDPGWKSGRDDDWIPQDSLEEEVDPDDIEEYEFDEAEALDYYEWGQGR